MRRTRDDTSNTTAATTSAMAALPEARIISASAQRSGVSSSWRSSGTDATRAGPDSGDISGADVAHPDGPGASSPLTPTDPAAALIDAIAAYVRRAHGRSDGQGGDDVSDAEAAQDGEGESSIVAAARRLEASLLLCLLHVQLTPAQLPTQPELIGAPTPAAQVRVPSLIHTPTRRRSTTNPGEDASPPPRKPEARAAGDAEDAQASHSTAVPEKQFDVSSSGGGSGKPRRAAGRGEATRAKELYYTYTRQGIPAVRPRTQHDSELSHRTAAQGPSRSMSRGEGRGARLESGGDAGRSRDAAGAPPPSFEAPPPVTELHARDTERRAAVGAAGTVRALHPTEMHAAMQAWPSRIAQYVLSTTLAEQELVHAQHTPASHPSRAAADENGSQAAEQATDEPDSELDALVRRLYDVLHHTHLGGGPAATGGLAPHRHRQQQQQQQQLQQSVLFPSFARFYVDGIDSGDAVQHYMTALTVAILSATSPGVIDDGAAARGALCLPTTASMAQNSVILSGDVAADIRTLLRHCPLVAASSSSSPSSPAATAERSSAAIAARSASVTAVPDTAVLRPLSPYSAPPSSTARAAVRRALRSLLHLSSSVSPNSVMCTTPLVVGVLRRYTHDATAEGRRLCVRLLPVAELISEEAGAEGGGEAADLHLRDAIRTAVRHSPVFYTALMLEVTGEDVLYPPGADAEERDAVGVSEEANAKVRYDADVPEAYRQRYRRRLEAQQQQQLHQHRSQRTRTPNSLSDSGVAAPSEKGEAAKFDASVSRQDSHLSREACALWEKLMAMVHFVHVTGTPAQVETTARHVALAIRRRREARQQQHQSTSAPASMAESATVPSVPAFFFTLSTVHALRCAAAATAQEARRVLFSNDKDGDEDDDGESDEARASRKSGSPRKSPAPAAAAVAAAAPARGGFFGKVGGGGGGGSGLGLRALLGWGRAAARPPAEPRAATPSPATAPLASRGAGSDAATQARAPAVPVASTSEPCSPATDAALSETAEDLIMDWMHDVLIPIFYETTVSASTTAAAAPSSKSTDSSFRRCESEEDEDGEGGHTPGSSRRRAPPVHLRSQRVLLGRVQAVTPNMVHGYDGSAAVTASSGSASYGEVTIAADRDADGEEAELVLTHRFDGPLLTYLLLRQLIFAPEGPSSDAAATRSQQACDVAARVRARSAPLPERASTDAAATPATPHTASREGPRNSRSATASQSPAAPHPRRAVSASPPLTPHSPTTGLRRVSFRVDATAAAGAAAAAVAPPAKLAAPLPMPQRHSGLLPLSPDPSTSLTGSPRSILKSGRRYKRERLVRSSAPAASVVPFRSLFVWRWLTAEVLGGDRRDAGASHLSLSSPARGPAESREAPAISTELRTLLSVTSTVYLHHTQLLAVRVAADSATAALLAGLLAEQYACYTQLSRHREDNGAATTAAGESASATPDGESTVRGLPHPGVEAEVAAAPRAGGLRSDDLLPIANSAAVAFVRAALAPLLCEDVDAPTPLSGVATSAPLGLGIGAVVDQEDATARVGGVGLRGRTAAVRGALNSVYDGCYDDDDGSGSECGSEQSSTGATSYVDGVAGLGGVRGLDAESRHGPDSSRPPHVISHLSPSLPAEVLSRLHTLAVVSLLHVRQEVLESVTRPLDVVLRRLAWALARHHLRLLRAPLDAFLCNATRAHLQHDSHSPAPRLARTERQLWSHVRHVLDLYESCLLLPHLVADREGVSSLSQTHTVEEASEDASAATLDPHGDSDVMQPILVDDTGGSPLTLLSAQRSVVAPSPKTRSGVRVPRLRLPTEEERFGTHTPPRPAEAHEGWPRQTRRASLVVTSARRRNNGFVPLTFGSASLGPDSSSPVRLLHVQGSGSITAAAAAVTAVNSALQPNSARWSMPGLFGRFGDVDDSFDLNSTALEGRAMRLASVASEVGAARAAAASGVAANGGLCSSGNIFGAGAAGDLVQAAMSGLSRPRRSSRLVSPRTFNVVASTSGAYGSRAVSPGGFAPLQCASRSASGSSDAVGGQAAGAVRCVSVEGVTRTSSQGSNGTRPLPLSACQPTPLVVPDLAVVDKASASTGGLEGAAPLDTADSPHHARHRRLSSHASSFLTFTSAAPVLHSSRAPSVLSRSASHLAVAVAVAAAVNAQEGEAVDGAHNATAGAAAAPPSPNEAPRHHEPLDDARESLVDASQLMAQVRSGTAEESPLLGPFVMEAKRVMVAALLQRGVLPWWAQLTQAMPSDSDEPENEETTTNGASTASTATAANTVMTAALEMTAARADTVDAQQQQQQQQQPHPLTSPQSGSVSPPTSSETVSTDSPTSGHDKRTDTGRSADEAIAMAQLMRENAALQARLQDTQRLLGDLNATCLGLRLAARQYELAVSFQRNEGRHPPTATDAPATTTTPPLISLMPDVSASIASGVEALAPPRAPDTASSSPASTAVTVQVPAAAQIVAMVEQGAAHQILNHHITVHATPGASTTAGAARAAGTDNKDAGEEGEGNAGVDRTSPQQLYLARAEEGRERVINLCQRMEELLAGDATANPDTASAPAAGTPTPPSLTVDPVPYMEHFTFGAASSPVAVTTSGSVSGFPTQSLSQGILGSQNVSLPEPTSAELAAAEAYCREDSELARRHSVMSHGPSQLFAPLDPRTLRRTSTAFTFTSLVTGPGAAAAMSATMATVTPTSTPMSTPRPSSPAAAVVMTGNLSLGNVALLAAASSRTGAHHHQHGHHHAQLHNSPKAQQMLIAVYGGSSAHMPPLHAPAPPGAAQPAETSCLTVVELQGAAHHGMSLAAPAAHSPSPVDFPPGSAADVAAVSTLHSTRVSAQEGALQQQQQPPLQLVLPVPVPASRRGEARGEQLTPRQQQQQQRAASSGSTRSGVHVPATQPRNTALHDQATQTASQEVFISSPQPLVPWGDSDSAGTTSDRPVTTSSSSGGGGGVGGGSAPSHDVHLAAAEGSQGAPAAAAAAAGDGEGRGHAAAETGSEDEAGHRGGAVVGVDGPQQPTPPAAPSPLNSTSGFVLAAHQVTIASPPSPHFHASAEQSTARAAPTSPLRLHGLPVALSHLSVSDPTTATAAAAGTSPGVSPSHTVSTTIVTATTTPTTVSGSNSVPARTPRNVSDFVVGEDEYAVSTRTTIGGESGTAEPAMRSSAGSGPVHYDTRLACAIPPGPKTETERDDGSAGLPWSAHGAASPHAGLPQHRYPHLQSPPPSRQRTAPMEHSLDSHLLARDEAAGEPDSSGPAPASTSHAPPQRQHIWQLTTPPGQDFPSTSGTPPPPAAPSPHSLSELTATSGTQNRRLLPPPPLVLCAVHRRCSVGTQVVPQTPLSTTPRRLQETSPNLATLQESDGSGSYQSGVECHVKRDGGEGDRSDVAAAPPVCRAIAKDVMDAGTGDGAGGVAPLTAATPTQEPRGAAAADTPEACLSSNPAAAAAAAASSSPLWRGTRTPARDSEAAVSALADLQQRLAGSSSAVTELRDELHDARAALVEKEAAVAELAAQLAETEASLRAAQQTAARATAAVDEAAQQRRAAMELRTSVAVETEGEPGTTRGTTPTLSAAAHPLLSPSCLSTPRLAAREADTTVAMLESWRGSDVSQATLLPTTVVSAETSTFSVTPPPVTVPPLQHRVAELEAELRNANFRMGEWRALLDAERHAHAVSVDQLAQQLESEQRRHARTSRSRSRSRSLSPLGSGAASVQAAEAPSGAAADGVDSAAGDTAELQRRVGELTDELSAARSAVAEERRLQGEVAGVVTAAHASEVRALRDRLTAHAQELRAGFTQRAQQERESATQREEALKVEVAAHASALAASQKAQQAAEAQRRTLQGELDAERRARGEADAEAAATAALHEQHRREAEEAVQRLQRELEAARARELATASVATTTMATADLLEVKRGEVAALREQLGSVTASLAAAESAADEQRQRGAATASQLAAAEAQRDALETRVASMEAELADARTQRAEWQRAVAGAEETARRALSTAMQEAQEKQEKLEEELRAAKAGNAAHADAMAALTQQLAVAVREAEQQHTAEESRRGEGAAAQDRRHAAALQEAEAKEAELLQRNEVLTAMLRLAELDVDEHRALQARVATLEEERRQMQAAHASQDAARAEAHEAALCVEKEAQARLAAALDAARAGADARQHHAEEMLTAEREARAADAAAHAAALASLQDALTAAQDAHEATQLDSAEAHERAEAEREAAQRAHSEVQRRHAAHELQLRTWTQAWWTARTSQAHDWLSAKTDIVTAAWGAAARAIAQQHTSAVPRSDVLLPPAPLQAAQRPQPALLPPPLSDVNSPNVAAPSDEPDKTRSRSRLKKPHHRHQRSSVESTPVHKTPSIAPTAATAVVAAPVPSPSPQPSSPEVLIVSVDDPLGLRYELQRKARDVAGLRERIRQLEQAHGSDQQTLATLQGLLAQEETRGDLAAGVAASAHTPLRTASHAWAASASTRDSAWIDGARTPPATRLWDAPRSGSRGIGSPPTASTLERRRWTPNEYRQRFAELGED